MDKRIKKTLLGLAHLVFGAILSFAEMSQAKEKPLKPRSHLKIGVPAVCPYACFDSGDLWTGYIVDVLNQVAKDNQKEIEFLDIPNSRLVQSLRRKLIDIAILPQYSFRYEPDIVASQSTIGFSLAGLATYKDDTFQYTDLSDLNSGVVIVADIGSETTKIISDIELNAVNAKPSILTGADSIGRLLKIIEIRRARFGIGDYNLLKSESKKFKNIKVQPTSIAGFSSTKLALLKNRPDLKEFDQLVSQWLTKARKNGELQKTLNKYNLEDWQILHP